MPVKVPEKAVANNMSQKDMQERIVVYKLLQDHIEQLKAQLEMIEKTSQEVEISSMAIEEIGKRKGESEALIPLGTGVFAEGKLSRPGRLFTNIGSGIFTTMDTASVKVLIDKKKTEITEVAQKIHEELQKTAMQVASIEQELKQAVNYHP